jgi:hypothetical protein
MRILKMAKENKTFKMGEVIVVETYLDAEVPYELVRIVDGFNGSGKLTTRTIRKEEKKADKKSIEVKAPIKKEE